MKKRYKKLGKQLRAYENQIDQLKEEINQLRSQGDQTVQEVASSSQIDILKRLSRLEYEVFKK